MASPSKTTNARLVPYIIERIQCLIPICSNKFHLILQTLPRLPRKLENAVRRQQQQKDGKKSVYSPKNYILSRHIDFSSFKSS